MNIIEFAKLRKIFGSSSGGGSGGGDMGTDVTATFSLMEGVMNTPKDDGETFNMADSSESGYSVYCGNVTSGQKYRVHCFPYSTFEIWRSFLFSNDDYSTLAVSIYETASYVTQVDNATYDITIPDGCEMLHINFLTMVGCSIFLLD